MCAPFGALFSFSVAELIPLRQRRGGTKCRGSGKYVPAGQWILLPRPLRVHPDPTPAWGVGFNSGNVYSYGNYRYVSQSVRPVFK